MSSCPQCPGRFFVNNHALQQHRESGRHANNYECDYCTRTFTTDTGRLSHQEAVHLECHYCDRNFNSEQARQQHERDKHPMHECNYCDQSFYSEDARQQHERDKHPTYECNYCDRSFYSEEARQQHERDKHPTYECNYCDRNFNSEQARQQHERDKHPPTYECKYCSRTFTTDTGRVAHQEAVHFECHYCVQKFNSEGARQQHERAKHAFECIYCDSYFWTEDAQQKHEGADHPTCRYCSVKFRFSSVQECLQHEASAHNFKCEVCSEVFTQADLLRSHKEHNHINCRYCADGFGTQSSKDIHEQSCAHNPATRVVHLVTPPDHSTLKSSPSSSSSSSEQEMIDQGSPASVITPPIELSASSHSSSDSTLEETEVLHLIGGISSSAGDGAMVEESCACIRSHESTTCFERTQASSNPDALVPDHVDNVISDHLREDHPAESRNLIHRCAACLDFFTEQAYHGHTCAYRSAILKPHCPVCYSQFENELLIRQHLEGSEAFSCQLCQTRCCSEEMKQDHLLSHPTCPKCGKSFTDNLALCGHLESGHPVVVCWECDGVVVEGDSLELHYAESPAHPSCVTCGLSTRNSDAMDEHVRRQHPSIIAMPNPPGGGGANVSPKQESPLTGSEPLREENVAGLPPDQPSFAPPSPVMEPNVPLGGPCDGTRNNPLQTESILPLSSHLATSTQAENISESARDTCVINSEQPLDRMDVDTRHYIPPSPAPSEHGSNVSPVQVHPTGVTDAAINDDIQPSSPVSTVSADLSFSDTSRTTSSHSVVFISADGIPDYIRENHAVLVATSAGSPSLGRTPLRLSSTSLLESLDMVERIRRIQAQSEERSTSMGNMTRAPHRLHCRICLKDPCEEMTATICGHVFCKRCITQAIVAKSECPVCKSAVLLYCLFKLDLSV